MTHFIPKHYTGRTVKPFQLMIHPITDIPETPKKEMAGGTLEGMSSKLEKLIVKPKKKHQNIKFNP